MNENQITLAVAVHGVAVTLAMLASDLHRRIEPGSIDLDLHRELMIGLQRLQSHHEYMAKLAWNLQMKAKTLN